RPHDRPGAPRPPRVRGPAVRAAERSACTSADPDGPQECASPTPHLPAIHYTPWPGLTRPSTSSASPSVVKTWTPGSSPGEVTARHPSASKLQEPFGIAVEDFRLVLGGDGQAVGPARPRRIVDKGVVDREQHAVDADLLDAMEQRRVGEEAAGG